jgi:hypothetical protein
MHWWRDANWRGQHPNGFQTAIALSSTSSSMMRWLAALVLVAVQQVHCFQLPTTTSFRATCRRTRTIARHEIHDHDHEHAEHSMEALSSAEYTASRFVRNEALLELRADTETRTLNRLSC